MRAVAVSLLLVAILMPATTALPLITEGTPLWAGLSKTVNYATASAALVSSDGLLAFTAGELNNDLHVVAFLLATGTPLWSFTTSGEDIGDGVADVALAYDPIGHRVFASTVQGPIVALDAATGVLLWSAPGAAREGNLVFDSETGLLFACGTQADTHPLVAFDAATGDPLWSGWTYGGIAFANGTLYFSSGLHTSALDPLTGEARWTTTEMIGNDPRVAISSEGDLVFVTTLDQGTAALDAVTGALRWVVPEAGRDIAADGERVYVDAVALDAATGAVTWRGLPRLFVADTALVGDRLISVQVTDFDIKAFDAATGDVAWQSDDAPASLVLQSRTVAATADGSRIVVAGPAPLSYSGVAAAAFAGEDWAVPAP